jgi:transcriptional regulator with XRE-family HTH domain
MRNINKAVGQRLKELRNKLGYSPDKMASKLDIDTTTYYRDENGVSFPGLPTLNRLRNDFNISMDWLIFGFGPVHYNEKAQDSPPVEIVKTKIHPIEEIMPDVKELLDCMAQDAKLRHEIMLNFYNYNEKKTNKPAENLPVES